MSAGSEEMIWLGPQDAAAEVTPELAGSKAAGIWRMGRLGLQIPPAFALPASLCAEVNTGSASAADRVSRGLRAGVERLEAAAGRRFGDGRAPLLVSVRSGAARSMPGMLSTVLDVGLSSEAVHGLIRLTGDPRLAWDSRRRFVESYATTVAGAPPAAFAAALAEIARAEAAEDESELDGEALERLAERFQETAAHHGAAPPEDPLEQLTRAALAVFRSWESPRARAYRRLNGLEGLLGTAVTVQVMVFGNGGPASGAGVAFTRDPSTGAKGLYVDVLFDAQGEDVVSGRRTPLDGAALEARLPQAYAALAEGAGQLERAFGDVQDIEFTVTDGRLYFLQTRSAKRTPRALLRSAIDLVHEGVLTPAAALERLAGTDLQAAATTRFAEPAPPLARGTPAAPGVASGRAAFDSEAARRLADEGDPVILVRLQPTTEDIAGFAAAAGILTAVGGRTAHAAVVARQMAKVCVVGCAGLRIDEAARQAAIGGQTVREGDWISMDGEAGEVTLGRREIVREAPEAELAELARWAAEAAKAPETA